ncbi:MAG: efflux RND transporter periplasmic adaptor subunit [Chloroflexi bacterium]|nr:efflux RND transporter periplasmic adaptor subunit [Chloroflexota bacterium]
MNTKKRLYLIALALLSTLMVLSGCDLLPMPAQSSGEWEMPTTTVSRGKITRVVQAVGQISPLDARELAFVTTGGRVKEVMVQKGQVVQEGDALVQLDTTDLESQLREAQADLRVAEAQLQAAQQPPSKADIAQAEAQLAYAEYLVADAKLKLDLATKMGLTRLEQEVADKQAALQLAQDQLAQQELNANQIEIRRLEYDEAFFQRAVRDAKPEDAAEAQKALDAAQRNLQAARAARSETLRLARQKVTDAQQALTLAQQELQRARSGEIDSLAAERLSYEKALASYEETKARLEQLHKGPASDALERAQTAYDAAAAKVETIQANIDASTLRAPISGVIFQVYAQTDNWIKAGDPIIYMADTSSLYIDAQVSEVDVVNMAVDQEVRVSLEAYPGKFVMGKVTNVDARGQSSSGMVYYQVRVVLEENPEQQVMPGMMATIRVLVGEKDGVLTVPIAALHYGRRGMAVTVQQPDGTWQDQPVEVGLNDGIVAEIISGLEEGQIVQVPISLQPPTEDGAEIAPGDMTAPGAAPVPVEEVK